MEGETPTEIFLIFTGMYDVIRILYNVAVARECLIFLIRFIRIPHKLPLPRFSKTHKRLPRTTRCIVPKNTEFVS
jgi:hypothetical protein